MYSFENMGTTLLITLQISTAEQQVIYPVIGQKYDQLAGHGLRYKQLSDEELNMERKWQDLTCIIFFQIREICIHLIFFAWRRLKTGQSEAIPI